MASTKRTMGNVIDFDDVKQKLSEHDDMIAALQENDRRIENRLGMTATHADIRRLETKIDDSTTTLLREAMSKIPDSRWVVVAIIIMIIVIAGVSAWHMM